MTFPCVMLLVVLLVLLVLGFPIVWALLAASVVSISLNDSLSFVIVAQRLFSGVDSFSLLAVPAFMLAGDIMCKGGLSRRLVNFADSLVGWISGGISLVAIVSCAFFAAISGSSVATTAAIGGLMHPELVKRGYPEDYSAAVQAIGGTLGIIIPPSVVFVIYGNATGVSIAKLLMSGVIPGAFACFALCFYAYLKAKRCGFAKGEHFSPKRVFTSLKSAFFALLMPVIILGGIYGSLFTPTEAAVVAFFYGLIVCLFIYREVSFKEVWQIAKGSAKTAANIMLLVASAQVFAYLTTYYNLPSIIAGWVVNVCTSKTIFLLVVIVVLLFAGMFMDNGSIILIMGPILAPIAVLFNINPVHFGLLVVFLLTIGQCTPPFGTCMFVACGIAKRPVSGVAKYLMPFIAVEIVCALLFAFVPAFSMALPNLISGT